MANSRTDLLAELLAKIPDNTQRLVTAQKLREVIAALVDSSFNLVDDASLLTPLALEGKVNKAGDTMTGQLTLVGDPTADNHAARKAYVDAVLAAAINGLSPKASVRGVVVDRAGPLAPLLTGTYTTLDGVALVAGDRVIVNGTVSPALNGIYVVASGAWSRAADADTGAKLVGATASVQEGTNFGDKVLLQATNGPIALGTTPVTWVTYGQPNNYVAGSGIGLTGTTISVDNTVVRATVTPGAWTNNTALDLAVQMHTYTSPGGSGTSIVVNNFTNKGTGRQVLLIITSAHASDTLAFTVSGGETIDYQGASFLPGVVNHVLIMMTASNRYLVSINPIA